MRLNITFVLLVLPMMMMAQVSQQQVQRIWEQMKARGQGIDEVDNIAKQRNMSLAETADLRNQIQKLDQVERAEQQRLAAEVNKKDKIFGWDVFLSNEMSFNPEVSFTPPADYVLGPGDNINVIIYGSAQKQYRQVIANNGKVNFPIVGPISLSGLTLKGAEAKIKQSLRKIYSGLKDGTASLELVLTEMRLVKVNIVGEVNRPGSYTLPSYTSVFNALYAAGGITENGTLRQIKHYKKGALDATVDLYDFLLGGVQDKAHRVEDNSVIVVGTFDKRVEIYGEIKRGGLFEVLGSETATDIINMAGGFTAPANRQLIALERHFGDDQFVKNFGVNEQLDFMDGDRILVYKTRDFLVSQVSIQGSVRIPGEYEYHKGMTIGDLLTNAGGVNPDAFTDFVSVFRKDSTQIAQIFKIDPTTNYTLEPGDHLLVQSKFEMFEEQIVEISGEVQLPGVIPFYPGMTLQDAILLSGGLNQASINGKIEIARRVNNGNNYEVLNLDTPIFDENSQDVAIEPYDHIFVRPSPGFQRDVIVSIEGEVNYPGEYVLASPKMRISKLLERAGGFTQNAFIEGATLYRSASLYELDENENDDISRYEELNDFLKDKRYHNSLSERQYKVLSDRVKDKIRVAKALEKEREEAALEDSVLMVDNDVTYDRIGIPLSAILSGSVEDDIILLPGDIISIPRTQQMVRIRGQVLNPSATKYEKSRNFRSYISQAGGFNLVAKQRKAFIVYPNGEAARTRSFLFFRIWPEVKPGSEIVVPGGRIRRPWDVDRVAALSTTLITTYLLLENFVTGF